MDTRRFLFFGPSTLAVAGAALLLGSMSCSRSPRANTARPAAGGPPPPAEAFRPRSPRQAQSAQLYLPGSRTRTLVNYDVVDGMAVYEGDILLGDASNILARYGVPQLRLPPFGTTNPNVSSAVASNRPSHIWPRGVMPYEIEPSAQGKRDFIEWAVNHMNSTNLTLRPRTASDRDYVVFKGDGDGCYSYVGRIGGPQEIQVAGCGRGSVAHEIMHAAGFFHEQSRSDRDKFVTIQWNNIAPQFRRNFEQHPESSTDIGPYDYGSILHYSAFAFSINGQKTIVVKQPGVRIGQREGLSPLDRSAINEIYSDGAPATTPPPVVAPRPTPRPRPAPPPVTPRPTPRPAPATRQGYAGAYTSQRGDVNCNEAGNSVTCTFPGGKLLCGKRNDGGLDCAWTGGGSGRATFARQADGSLRGTYGDFLSNNSRGAWDLTPTGGGAAPPPARPQPRPAPGPTRPAPAPAPGGQRASLSGTFNSTRGPMNCNEQGARISCSFNENGVTGRLDCAGNAAGLQYSCTWTTNFPRPGGGRAVLSRQSASQRELRGTWGMLTATSGGGTWDITP